MPAGRLIADDTEVLGNSILGSIVSMYIVMWINVHPGPFDYIVIWNIILVKKKNIIIKDFKFKISNRIIDLA